MRTASLTAVLPSGAARTSVLLLALGSFALGTDAYVISGVLSDVAKDLNVSLAVAGLLITVFSGVYAIGAPILAVVTGTINRNRLLLIALSIFVAANLLAAVSPNYLTIVAARVLAAIGAGLYTPTAAATAATLAKPEERGRALATVLGGLTIANFLGVPIGTLIGQLINWRATFVFVAAVGLVALIGIARDLGPIPSNGVPSLSQRATAARLPGVPTTLLSTLLAICGASVIYTYLAWFANTTVGLAGAAVTLVFLMYGLGSVIANLAGGWLIDHMPPFRVAFASMAGLVVVFLLASGFAGVSTHNLGWKLVLAVIVLVWALSGWLFYPAQQKRLITAAGQAEGPVVLGLAASAIYGGQAIAGVAGSALLSHGAVTLALTATVFEVLAVAVLLISTRGIERNASSAPDADDSAGSDSSASSVTAADPAPADRSDEDARSTVDSSAPVTH